MSAARLVIPFFIPHAGCPFQCVFCDQRSITGEQDAARPDTLRDTIISHINTYKQKPTQIEAAFFGGSFTGLPAIVQDNWLLAARKAKEEGLITGIRLSTRPDYINKRILDNLMEYGVTTIELGVQSLADEVLEKSGRGYRADTVREATRLIRTYPFDLVYQLMIGLPNDNQDTAYRTAVMTVQARPDAARIYPTVVLRGTKLAQWYEQGIFRPWSLSEAVNMGKVWLATFMLYGIDVIRMGLQFSPQLVPDKGLLAGPYHPAYGELAESALFLEQVCDLLQKRKEKGKSIALYFNPADYSKITGQKRGNIFFLKNRLGLEEVRLIADSSIASGDIRIDDGQTALFSRRQDFLEKYRIQKGDE